MWVPYAVVYNTVHKEPWASPAEYWTIKKHAFVKFLAACSLANTEADIRDPSEVTHGAKVSLQGGGSTCRLGTCASLPSSLEGLDPMFLR